MGRLRAGMTATPTRITVGAQLASWLDERRGKVKSGTWVVYEVQVRIHLRSLHAIPLARLTPADVRRMVREREVERCSPATIRQTLVVLRMALRQAVKDGLIPRNVAEGESGPRIQRRELEVYQDSEPARLIDAAQDDELGALWLVMLGTALRLGEALGLRWQDVGREEVTVAGQIRAVDRRFRAGERLTWSEPKTDESAQTAPIADFAIAALQRHREAMRGRPANRHGLVFTSPRGTPLDPRNVARSWYAFLDRAGLRRIRVHDIRHTAISLALAQGATLEDAKRMARHKSIRQTSDTYGHLVRSRQREIASMLDRAVAG
jgi:integrase